MKSNFMEVDVLYQLKFHLIIDELGRNREIKLKERNCIQTHTQRSNLFNTTRPLRIESNFANK